MNTEHSHGLNQADPRTMMEGTKVYPDSSVDPGDGVVKVPKIYWEFTTKGILTMEWIDGIKLTDRDALLSANLDIQQLVDQVLPSLQWHLFTRSHCPVLQHLCSILPYNISE
jgi:aarF domain-containing kinase